MTKFDVNSYYNLTILGNLLAFHKWLCYYTRKVVWNIKNVVYPHKASDGRGTFCGGSRQKRFSTLDELEKESYYGKQYGKGHSRHSARRRTEA